MTKIVKVKTGAKLEKLSNYSRIVMVDNWISVSNTAGRNPVTQEIPEDLAAQTHQVFANIVAQLWHVGRISHPSLLGGALPVAPSAIASGDLIPGFWTV